MARNPVLGVSATAGEVQTLGNLGTSSRKPSTEGCQDMPGHMGGSLLGWMLVLRLMGSLSGRAPRGNERGSPEPRQLVYGAYYNGQGAGSTQEPSSGAACLLEPQLLVSQRKILNKINSRNSCQRGSGGRAGEYF